MGAVIGKESAAEPPFRILLDRTSTPVAYEIRKYGERFAAETAYTDASANSPFRALARYIGVFGAAENDGAQPMAMTAPVVLQNKKRITTDSTAFDGIADGEHQKIMKFMLPAEYDTLTKIPTPSNSAVSITKLPPSVGAVHRYSGKANDVGNRVLAKALGDALVEDGVSGITEDYVMNNFEYWGYNPPFTLPWFRRNEVWVELSQEQVDELTNKHLPLSETNE
mmetsp:Transcript_20717/g.24702  ORF Transcript_20717/g.24702 Transcript_20717/m.24702 type:complete len:224 (-) Transcript_20717:281-952(-)